MILFGDELRERKRNKDILACSDGVLCHPSDNSMFSYVNIYKNKINIIMESHMLSPHVPSPSPRGILLVYTNKTVPRSYGQVQG